jgi:Peptidase family C25/Propeptide_C25/Secretion system C-terminal sorting domain/Peptidase family C25, C terminal ig-like domain
MRKVLLLTLVLFCTVIFAEQDVQQIQFEDNWGERGFTLQDQSTSGVNLNYSIQNFTIQELELDNEILSKISLPGNIIPNDEGRPDLPAESRFIAIPEGAKVRVEIVSSRTETFQNMEIMPAPRIPLDTEKGPLEYRKSEEIYSQNAFFPANPVTVSDMTEIRGVDAVILGITPFQYNPVTKELLVYKDLEIQVSFVGGNGQFGENRLRSIWWEPILKGTLINYEILPEFSVNKSSSSRTDDYEYIIISPDDPAFLAWADSISVFRNLQGVRTGVVSTTEIGGNTTTAIETYINDAYNDWDIPPVAVLLLGDYGTVGSTIVSPIWNNYCVSDHIYADVTGNSVTDVILARITAQDEADLETMIMKFLDYERNPITDADYYDHPITALGWQTERWFQLCSETIGGFWSNEIGKNPVRINALYEGNPDVDPWSTAQNTTTVLNYFGPNGLGYIPQTPAELGGWTGGNATMVNNAINDGSFMLIHRDHGGENGWGEPSYGNNNVALLTNEYPVYVFSINCLTGKYNINGECFAEAFHRHEQGALGLIAASEVSYSFVNDAYMWGAFDHMWPDFLPDQGTYATDCDFILPAFANAAGKTFLMGSSWPYNNQSKPVTYNLFHQHGGAFMNIYSEVPEQLSVNHADELVSGLEEFVVTADEGSFIGLTVNGEVIGTAVGTGSPVYIAIPAQSPNASMIVTVTKQNHFRYSEEVEIIAPGQYVVFGAVDLVELDGHLDNSIQSLDTVQMDITLNNIGLQPTGNQVNATLTTSSNQVVILDDAMQCVSIPASSSLLIEDAFQVEFLEGIEDHTFITFELEVEADGDTWSSTFEVEVLAPILTYEIFELDVTSGVDEILDPGETGEILVLFENSGSGYSYNSSIVIYSTDTNITLSGSGTISVIDPGQIGVTEQPFNVIVNSSSPVEYFAEINVIIQDESTLSNQDMFYLPIGFIAHNFEAGEGNWEHMPITVDWLDEWHLSSYRNHTEGGMYSMKCGGEDGENYSNFIYAALVMPEIELGANSVVKFHHWMHVGANNNGNTWDGGLIEISVNGGDWEQITPVGGYPCTMLNMPTSPFAEGTEVFAGIIDWEEVELDLSAYSGVAQIRFVMGSTGLVTFEGWYIDDVYYTNPTGIDDGSLVPMVTGLNGNYPNPFNPSTTISFQLNTETTENTDIVVYNLKGQKVKQLLNNQLSAGKHTVVWNGKDDFDKSVASGVYFYKMKAGKFVSTKKMILMK